MYLIDHVAELRFVNRLIYAIKRIYTYTIVFAFFWPWQRTMLHLYNTLSKRKLIPGQMISVK